MEALQLFGTALMNGGRRKRKHIDKEDSNEKNKENDTDNSDSDDRVSSNLI